jgi:hypothetical protein
VNRSIAVGTSIFIIKNKKMYLVTGKHVVYDSMKAKSGLENGSDKRYDSNLLFGFMTGMTDKRLSVEHFMSDCCYIIEFSYF